MSFQSYGTPQSGAGGPIQSGVGSMLDNGYNPQNPGTSSPGAAGKSGPGFGQSFNQIGPVLGEAANTLGGTADPALVGQAFGQIGGAADTVLGGSTPGMGGKGAPGMGGKAPQQGPQQGFDGRPLDQQFPGAGGKGPSGAPNGLNQLPVDMNGQVLGTGQPPDLPPGAHIGFPEDNMLPPRYNTKPSPAPMPAPRPSPFAKPQAYGRNAVVNPRARVTPQPVQSMKRGAGRGGVLR